MPNINRPKAALTPLTEQDWQALEAVFRGMDHHAVSQIETTVLSSAIVLQDLPAAMSGELERFAEDLLTEFS